MWFKWFLAGLAGFYVVFSKWSRKYARCVWKAAVEPPSGKARGGGSGRVQENVKCYFHRLKMNSFFVSTEKFCSAWTLWRGIRYVAFAGAE
jgi:hypothetical protein